MNIPVDIFQNSELGFEAGSRPMPHLEIHKQNLHLFHRKLFPQSGNREGFFIYVLMFEKERGKDEVTSHTSPVNHLLCQWVTEKSQSIKNIPVLYYSQDQWQQNMRLGTSRCGREREVVALAFMETKWLLDDFNLSPVAPWVSAP